MNKSIRYTSSFKSDIKKVNRRYKDLSALREVISILSMGHALPAKFKDHKLLGKYKGSRECHIFPDLLLIYDNNATDALVVQRLGSHSELFK